MTAIQCTCRPTFTRVTDMPARMRLRSSISDQLIVPSYNLSTVGRWAFPVSSADRWNSLSAHLTSALSFTVFRQRLKSFLFRRSSYLTLKVYTLHVVDLAVTLVIQATLKNVVDDDNDDDTSLISSEVPRRDRML